MTDRSADLSAVPAHVLADVPSIRPGRPQPDDGMKVGYEEGILHLGDGVHRVYLNHRKTCAQTRLGEAHSAHEFEYLYRDPFTSDLVHGGYYCDGLPDDRDPFPCEPTSEDMAASTTAWQQGRDSRIDAYQQMARLLGGREPTPDANQVT